MRRAARLGDAARLVDGEIRGVFHKLAALGADTGDVRAAFDVRVQHLLQRQIDDKVAVGQDDVLLPDLVQVRPHARERLHLAAEFLHAELARVGKGRQQLETAVLARHVPRLAAADVVEQALIVAVQHNADVCDARARHVGEHEVDHAVAPAERHRAGHARFGQLAKAGSLFIGKDDAVQSVHRTVSFPSTLRMRLAGST